MRTFLSIVAMVIMSGCAGPRDFQWSGRGRGDSRHATPVVTEQLSLSDRLKYGRQQGAERAAMALTEVQGAIKQ
jgi:hypothetical protein